MSNVLGISLTTFAPILGWVLALHVPCISYQIARNLIYLRFALMMLSVTTSDAYMSFGSAIVNVAGLNCLPSPNLADDVPLRQTPAFSTPRAPLYVQHERDDTI
ncbi:hypothetical protein K431DRAFT_14730 [Polychaeton citri CBS 116435]|uniref:Uncharacterized protein n=1 Tax=Polychaeton citri CBS 116435 TaxID=1314669 RepID=A0A9P4QCB4_9PEZI|nr:hypothetical protein K431DRAFT_14730 [Polychaeton citri CBS 116435]